MEPNAIASGVIVVLRETQIIPTPGIVSMKIAVPLEKNLKIKWKLLSCKAMIKFCTLQFSEV